VTSDRLLCLQVEPIDAHDACLDAPCLPGWLEGDELHQSDADDDDTNGDENQQRAVEGSQLVVAGGAQARSVEWICRPVVKAETNGGWSRCRDVPGATSANVSTSTSRKGCASGALERRNLKKSPPAPSTRSAPATERPLRPV